ncbi:alkaline phosphatase family protein [Nocardioides bizhenqiangii]|uniref:Alkaline phosphatase family protein n=1 Tax=Nocardioides bizhenqiangii TaxID=3095076 RepID=A0ABZ0ZVP4_9ACTN|nr:MULTISPECIES: alkaline phosphatase family protein [unclassified Nocardioides]MDZ5623397.1 alkaline phosphatase family protein [Nocardioides sp. HM23]WQQ27722.1 alkaline phosphatase family protein [Nocardioides sp. HM61]
MTSSAPRDRRLAVVSVGLALTAMFAPTPAPASDALSVPAGATVRHGEVRQVLAISLDGFNVDVLKKLGRRGAPNLHRLFRNGASTKNARTQVELTVTLPNHTSQLTGRRIFADGGEGGHGVTWNDDRPIRPDTIQAAAGEDVFSIFTQAHLAGRTTALFATESKFSLFKRSWPGAVNRSTIVQDGDHAVTVAARRDLLRRNRGFTFLHLGAMDEAGHAHGWFSRPYLRAARLVDAQLGILLEAIREHNRLHDLAIVLTADHGGPAGETRHDDATKYANFRIPFLVWGPGVERGDLYAMNPTYADPGTTQPGFAASPQPIRNGDLANLSANLLGLTSVPGSLWGLDQSLTWHN